MDGASINSVKAVLILSGFDSCNRLYAKYYDDEFPTVAEQREFEKSVWEKTNRVRGDVLLMDGSTIVYRQNIDTIVYVIGSYLENELLLGEVLYTIFECIEQIPGLSQVEDEAIMQNIGEVMLIIDAVLDNGIVLETSPDSVIQIITTMKDQEKNRSITTDQDVQKIVNSGRNFIRKFLS